MAKAVAVIVFVAAIFVGIAYFVWHQEAPRIASYEPDKIHLAYSNIVDLYGDLGVIHPWADNRKKYGGICSHHFFVSRQIAEFFSGLKDNPPKTIVILGPNHYGVGDSHILISLYPYQTPWGLVEPDLKLVNKLIQNGVAVNDEKPFEREHSISALMGFIRYFLPQTKIVPIIFKFNTSQAEADMVADKLIPNIDGNTFLMASVDFSHHVDRQTAINQDQKSTTVIKGFDFEKIYDLDLDSPPSIYILLKYLKFRHAQNMEYQNYNAADLLGDPAYQDVTSYVFAYFGK